MSQPFEVSLLVWWDLSTSNPTFASKGDISIFKKIQCTSAHPHNQTIGFFFAENSLKLCTSNGFVDDGPSHRLTQCFAVPSAATLCLDTRQSEERLFFSCNGSLPTPRTLT